MSDILSLQLCCAEIGIGLTGLGFLFLFLGVLFFFDKGLIALGNVRCLSTARAQQ